MSGWTDAHCHLQDEFLEEGGDAAVEVRAVLERAYDAGVDRVVVIGTGAKSSEDALSLTATSQRSNRATWQPWSRSCATTPHSK